MNAGDARKRRERPVNAGESIAISGSDCPHRSPLCSPTWRQPTKDSARLTTKRSRHRSPLMPDPSTNDAKATAVCGHCKPSTPVRLSGWARSHPYRDSRRYRKLQSNSQRLLTVCVPVGLDADGGLSVATATTLTHKPTHRLAVQSKRDPAAGQGHQIPPVQRGVHRSDSLRLHPLGKVRDRLYR